MDMTANKLSVSSRESWLKSIWSSMTSELSSVAASWPGPDCDYLRGPYLALRGSRLGRGQTGAAMFYH